MNIRIESVLKVGKGITVKIEKQPDDTEKAIAHLKFSEALITREHLDQLVTGVIGSLWPALYDESGAPIARMTIGLPYLEVVLGGTISGNKNKRESLALIQATLTGVEMALVPNGAHLSGELTWEAAGDEVSDAEPLLGQLCACNWTIDDRRQGDLLAQSAPTLVDRLREAGATMEISHGDQRVTLS